MTIQTQRRLELHEILCDILGSRYVYFEPPESMKLKYPCIVYKRKTGDVRFANNKPYNLQTSYQITCISQNPDEDLVEKIAYYFPKSRPDNHFTSDNLNHDVFSLYY